MERDEQIERERHRIAINSFQFICKRLAFATIMQYIGAHASYSLYDNSYELNLLALL